MRCTSTGRSCFARCFCCISLSTSLRLRCCIGISRAITSCQLLTLYGRGETPVDSSSHGTAVSAYYMRKLDARKRGFRYANFDALVSSEASSLRNASAMSESPSSTTLRLARAS